MRNRYRSIYLWAEQECWDANRLQEHRKSLESLQDVVRLQKQHRDRLQGYVEALDDRILGPGGPAVWAHRVDGRWFTGSDLSGPEWKNVHSDIACGNAIGPACSEDGPTVYNGPVSAFLWRSSLQPEGGTSDDAIRTYLAGTTSDETRARPKPRTCKGRLSRLAPHLAGFAVTTLAEIEAGSASITHFLQLFDPAWASLNQDASENETWGRCAEIAPFGCRLAWDSNYDGDGNWALVYRPCQDGPDSPLNHLDRSKALKLAEFLQLEKANTQAHMTSTYETA